jgi:hypothetical protein
MSRNALILERSSMSDPAEGAPSSRRPCEFQGLVHRFFRESSALAIIGVGPVSRSAEACRGLAREVGASGNRVVIVPVRQVLQTSSPPTASTCIPGPGFNVWLWPGCTEKDNEFCPDSRNTASQRHWLASLRSAFDWVLLDCSGIDASPGAAEVAASAETALLVAEAGQTTREQIWRKQRTLELRGVKLAGSILMQRR